MIRTVGAVVASLAFLSAQTPVAPLQGRWVVTAAELQAKPFSAVVGGVFTVDGDDFEIRTAGGNILSGTLQLTPGQPSRMNLVHADGTRWEAIYEITNGRFRLQYVEGGGAEPRPRQFETSAASEAALLELQREPLPVAGSLPPRVVPPPPVPYATTPARVELGRHLFYDTRLSGNGTQSCATCHQQARAFTDGRAQGLGSTGMLHPRSPMTLVNVAYRDPLTWANPSVHALDEQALVPMLGTSPVELGLLGHEERVYTTLAADATYRRLFAAAFPGDSAPVTRSNIAASLAAFQRSIVSFRSPFDRYRQHEDRNALSAAARRGSVLFFSGRKARCFNCHRGLNLDGSDLLNTGVNEDTGTFRIPTLRNVALTAPYMHDGSIATLDAVLDHYVAGGRTANPMKSDVLRPLLLSAQERSDLIAFLASLTDREALVDPRWGSPWN